MESEYEKKALQLEREVIKYSSEAKWNLIKNMDGVEVSYHKSPHFTGQMYKFSCTFDAPCSVVYEVLKPPPTTEERMSWDKTIANYKRIVTFSDSLNISVISSASAMMGLIAPREFLDLFVFKSISSGFKNDTVYWIFSESVKCDKHPETSNIVRAHTYPSGYCTSPVNGSPDQTNVNFYINIDAGGKIPRSLVESTLPAEQIKFIQCLRKEISRRAKLPPST